MCGDPRGEAGEFLFAICSSSLWKSLTRIGKEGRDVRTQLLLLSSFAFLTYKRGAVTMNLKDRADEPGSGCHLGWLGASWRKGQLRTAEKGRRRPWRKAGEGMR